MSTIYILQKEVPSLGLLTKVGMTTRDGDDRASEYGGGGWQIVRQFTTKMRTTADLRDLERRIHERLDEYRCRAAKEFGLTEVFTCSAAHAISVAADEIGADPAGDDRVERLRKRTNRGIVRKIMQQHESALAKFHMKGSGAKAGSDFFGALFGGDPSGGGSELRRIHEDTLRALDNCGEGDETFREMLKREIKKIDDGAREQGRENNEKKRPG